MVAMWAMESFFLEVNASFKTMRHILTWTERTLHSCSIRKAVIFLRKGCAHPTKEVEANGVVLPGGSIREQQKTRMLLTIHVWCTWLRVCVRHALIYAHSVRYVDIADAVIILAVPHISCGRSSIGTKISMGIKVLEGYENDASYLS